MVQDNVRLFQSHANRLVDDPLTEILREKAREILAVALELEAAAFLDALQHLRLKDGRRRAALENFVSRAQTRKGAYAEDDNSKPPRIAIYVPPF